MSPRKYACTQRELYAVCASGWESCNQNLEKFTSFRPLYTSAFIEAKLKEIADVSALPHRSKRSAKQDLARTELKNKLTECHDAWKKLKLAVPALWPADQHEAHYKDMGRAFYRDSLKMKWEACTGLMDSALSFVQEHAALLQGSERLGPQFVDDFKLLTESLRLQLQKYVSKLKDEGQGADEKVQGCNAIHKELMLMFADAKIIFKNDPVKLKNFIFEAQIDLVSGQNSAGIKGMISNGQLPVSQIEGLLLTLAENGDEAYVEDDGTYRFSQLAAGKYTMQVNAPGYQEQLINDIAVNTGAYSTRNITLVPEVPVKEDATEIK